MPENEFEKQVKELMEELHFSPSAPVWENIKKRIRERKRRVWPIFFLLISVATVSGYFFYTDIKHTNQNTKKNSETFNIPSTKNLPGNTRQEKNNKKDSAFKTQSQTQELSGPKTTNNSNDVFSIKHLKNPKLVFSKPSIKKNNTEIADTFTDKNSFTNTQPSNANNSINTVDQQNPGSNNILEDTGANKNADLESLVKINKETSKTDSITAVDKNAVNKKIKTRKWQWGISAMYGNSTISNNILNSNADKSLQTAPNLNPGTVFGANPGISKNPYNSNNAYSFGIAVQRKISKQSSLNTGINFVHLSSKSNTARSVDSSLVLYVANSQGSNYANSFYRVGSAKTYTNNFNFIEIPVTFQSTIFHVNKFSLLYNAGASVMQLISSKALVYDQHTNTLFSNDDLLRHTQFQLMAGLNFQLKLKNNNSILLGPNFEYSLTPYLKDNNYSRLHFMNYGLKASWLFNKK